MVFFILIFLIFTSPSDFSDFYKRFLRPNLMICYKNMVWPTTYQKVFFITMEDFVLCAMKYPPHFRKDLWGQVIDKWIIVKDNDQWIYPGCFVPPSDCLMLRQPIQILSRLNPPVNSNLFYIDASPAQVNQLWGGGGVVWVKGNGEIVTLGAVFRATSSFVSEGEVFSAVTRFAKAQGLAQSIFISDSLDLVEGLTGRSYFNPFYEQVFCRFVRDASLLEDAVFLHSPRDGNSLADSIARGLRETVDKRGIPKGYVTGEVQLLPVNVFSDPEILKLLDKLQRRIPELRVEAFPASHVLKTHPTVLASERRQVPREVEPYFTNNPGRILTTY